MDFGRGKIRQRIRDLCLLLGFAGLMTLVVNSFAVGKDDTVSNAFPLTVQYRTDTANQAPVAHPWLQVVNTGQVPVNLDAVTLRYYLADADGAPYAFNCVRAAVGCSNVLGAFVTPPNPAAGADRYLQIGFAPDAGQLAPGKTSQEIRLQIWRLDHKGLDQGGDRSFSAAAGGYAPATTITAYRGAALVWGTEPAGHSAAPDGSVAPPIPSGIVFDAFHYSGASDPALAAHGWGVRTGVGGPGIHDTWTAKGVTFPRTDGAIGGQSLDLTATTTGAKTPASTTQAEIESTGMQFLTGTFAARVYFSPGPTSGKPGDAINEAFYMISPRTPNGYSELDNEYMPNGWYSLKGQVLDNTSWYDSLAKDRVTQRHLINLAGWHTLVVTAMNGQVAYYVDGVEMTSAGSRYVPRIPMTANFNAWFGDLYTTGTRAWDMRVNWFYANSAKAVSTADVESAVAGLYAQGSTFVNTVPAS